MTQLALLTQLAKRTSLQDFPLGVYVLTREGKIVTANRAGRELLKLPREGEVEVSLTSFFRDPSVQDEMLRRLDEAGEDVEWMETLVPMKVNGDEKLFRSYNKAVRAESNEHIGCLCLLVDVTEKGKLRDALESLTYDFGSVLHTYAATLITVHQAVVSVKRSLAPDPFDGEGGKLSPRRVGGKLAGPAERLAKSIDTLLKAAPSRKEHPTPAGTDPRETLARMLGLIREQERLEPELRATVLREVAFEVVDASERSPARLFPREALRQVRRDARELMRVTSLLSLQSVQQKIVGIEFELQALREFMLDTTKEVLEGKRKEKAVCRVSELVAAAAQSLKGFAESRRVRVVRDVEGPDIRVEVVERDVVRAISNLLHNAIKYSWEHASGRGAQVSVRVGAREGRARVEIENYGVPIPYDELSRGLIFQLGYRGRMSARGGSTGTGVGLADARRVAREHGGDVTVVSRPVAPDRSAHDYTQPFLTHVTFELLAYSGERR